MSRHTHRETGRVVEVTADTLGSSLTTLVGTTTAFLDVDDASDFDPEGGWVRVGGATVREYGSVTFGEDTGSDSDRLHLVGGGFGATADEGDPVEAWDPAAAAPYMVKVASVRVDGDEDAADTVEATIPARFAGAVTEGIRSTRSAEAVTIRLVDDEWVVDDITVNIT